MFGILKHILFTVLGGLGAMSAERFEWEMQIDACEDHTTHFTESRDEIPTWISEELGLTRLPNWVAETIVLSPEGGEKFHSFLLLVSKDFCRAYQVGPYGCEMEWATRLPIEVEPRLAIQAPYIYLGNRRVAWFVDYKCKGRPYGRRCFPRGYNYCPEKLALW